MTGLVETTSLKGGIRQITLNRPDKKNALTEEMYIELETQMKLATESANVRAILLNGKANCFCAGNDIEDFLKNPPKDENSPVFRFLRTLNRVEKPIVAAVNGVAVGIGTTLLLHCDLVYASPSSTFSTPFVNLGCTPEGASSILIPEIMGQRKAAELLMLCRPFNAQKAIELGIITALSNSSDALEEALKACHELVEKPPIAVREAKRILKKNLQEKVEQTIIEEARLFCERLQSDEANEALHAFAERRKPDFSRF